MSRGPHFSQKGKVKAKKLAFAGRMLPPPGLKSDLTVQQVFSFPKHKKRLFESKKVSVTYFQPPKCQVFFEWPLKSLLQFYEGEKLF